jgi:hypothetical protein
MEKVLTSPRAGAPATQRKFTPLVTLDATVAPELSEVLDHAEEWAVTITREEIEGDGRATRMARIGIFGHWGEDNAHDHEAALLLRLPDGPEPPRVVWFGLGSTRENRFDVCRLEGRAQFRLVDGPNGTFIERRIRSRRSLERPRMDAQLAASLVRRCTVRARPPARFPALP